MEPESSEEWGGDKRAFKRKKAKPDQTKSLIRMVRGLSQKLLATHFSILAWKIPWAEEPGRLQSLGLQRVGQD